MPIGDMVTFAMLRGMSLPAIVRTTTFKNLQQKRVPKASHFVIISTHRSTVLGDVVALVAAEALLQADLVVVLVLDPVLLVLRLVGAAGVGAAVEGATGPGMAMGRCRAYSLVQFHLEGKWFPAKLPFVLLLSFTFPCQAANQEQPS